MLSRFADLHHSTLAPDSSHTTVFSFAIPTAAHESDHPTTLSLRLVLPSPTLPALVTLVDPSESGPTVSMDFWMTETSSSPAVERFPLRGRHRDPLLLGSPSREWTPHQRF
jgi:hypothetical protein